MPVAKPKNEEARVAALEKYAILDTDPEAAFDDLTLLASFVCKTPIALITLIDESRQWIKSHVGISVSETSRDVAFCSQTILQKEVLVVPDALQRVGNFSENLPTTTPASGLGACATALNAADRANTNFAFSA